jgi:aminoglycoside phosphotransferase (APT) family kinase protein
MVRISTSANRSSGRRHTPRCSLSVSSNSARRVPHDVQGGSIVNPPFVMTADEPTTYRTVLSRYPAEVAKLHWSPLGPHGGFSGALLWRGDLDGKPALALKAWPRNYPAKRLAAIHRWMAEAYQTGLVPAVVPALSGLTLVEHAGRVWDVTAWMPGAADFQRNPNELRLKAACAALAELHRCWALTPPQMSRCPGILRRLEVLTSFDFELYRFNPICREPLSVLARRVPALIDALRTWSECPVPIIPCHGDIHQDHVLFIGDRVTGIIDFGAMKHDHPAADLARLLGDIASGEQDRMRIGLDSYRAAGGPVDIDPDLLSVLDKTGQVCVVIHWLSRLALQQVEATCLPGRFKRLMERLCDNALR